MPKTSLVHRTSIALVLALAASASPALSGADEPPSEPAPEASAVESRSTSPIEDQEDRDPVEDSGGLEDGDQLAEAPPKDEGVGSSPSDLDDAAGSAGEDTSPGVGFGDDWNVRSIGIGGSFGFFGLDLSGMQTEEGNWDELVRGSETLRDVTQEATAESGTETSSAANSSSQEPGREEAPDPESAEGEQDSGSTDG